jgi:hypothetical protein
MSTGTRPSLPSPDEITDLEIAPGRPGSSHPAVSNSSFLTAWATARPMSASDPMVMGWSYAPWFSGRFRARSETLAFRVFLGGLGVLEHSSGTSELFLVDATLIHESVTPTE